ncbi:hypothetical protein Tco_1325649, partial [Tanacetum coccineum]
SPSHQTADQHEPMPDLTSRPTPTIPDYILQGVGGNVGDQSSNDRSLLGSEDGLTLQSLHDLCISLREHESLKKKRMQKESVFKQGRKSAKAEPFVPKDPAFDNFDDLDGLDYMETEAYTGDRVSINKQTVSTDRDGVSTDKQIVSTDRDGVSTEATVSTDKQKVSTDRHGVSTISTKLSTDKNKEGTAEPKDIEPKASTNSTTLTPTPTTATPTPTIFRDDETIAQVLLNMS